MDIARRWIEHGVGQIAVVVSLGTEHGRVCGQVANTDNLWTRPWTGQGYGQLAGLRRVCVPPRREHCVGNRVDDSPDAACLRGGLLRGFQRQMPGRFPAIAPTPVRTFAGVA